MSVLESEPPRFTPGQAEEIASSVFGVTGTARSSENRRLASGSVAQNRRESRPDLASGSAGVGPARSERKSVFDWGPVVKTDANLVPTLLPTQLVSAGLN
jgi:hypothetical protein